MPVKCEDAVAKRADLTRWLPWILGLAVIATGVLVGLYVFQFQGPLSQRPESWGQFGDYIGGTLGPLLSFLALLALLFTIVIQSKALDVSRRELANSTVELRHSVEALRAQNESLRLQTFEAAFFQLLRFHNEIVEGIDIRAHSADASATTIGRDCFKVFYRRLEKAYDRSDGDLSAAYMNFFHDNQADVGHYFRHLYHIIKFVDGADIEDPKRYTTLVRAELSTFELLLLFYNCLSPLGREKFRPLVETYSLLKNMPREELLSAEHTQEYDRSAFEST